MLFKQCITEASDFGYHQGCMEFDIFHLCFADDLFVFTRGDVASVDVTPRLKRKHEAPQVIVHYT